MAGILDQLDEEQRQEVLREAAEYQAANQPAAAQVSIALPSGRAFTGTAEEANAALQEEYQEMARQRQEQPAPQGNQMEQRQQWNQDKFKETFVNDASQGLDQYFEYALGFHPKKGFEAVGQALTALVGRLDRLDQSDFLRRHPEIDAHFDKLKDVAQENGWAINQDTLEKSYILAKGQGLIDAQEGQGAPRATQQPLDQTANFNAPPAFVPSGGGGASGGYGPGEDSLSEADRAELDKIAAGMTVEELGSYLRKNDPVRQGF